MSLQTTDDPVLSRCVTDENGAIDEDLYCLSCGYNLRGLTGDPVRCPECGEFNSLGMAAIPAEMIRQALRKMETAPTGCAGCAFGGLCFASLFLWSPTGGMWPIALAALLCLAAWLLFCRRMKTVYEGRPGWRRMLLDFHFATLLCTAAIPMLVIARVVVEDMLVSTPGTVVLGVLFGSFPFVVWGLRVYSSARIRIAVMQREAAVRIAKKALRLAFERRRRS